ncbi:hypothetical protein [Mycobacterium camsae]|uniref:hypothetical protein n=1 Tax=Mycobacterium gordonae TaxID=1778 RepID=UPI001F11BCF1|nr:hypothetical protein [Mycobacterium gordonae]
MSAPAPARLRARRLLLALGAGALYGGWAAVANCAEGPAVALRAAATQLLLSTFAALALELLIERIYRSARTSGQGFWLAATGASTSAGSALAAGHGLMGTPHIARTIAPSVVIGTVFCFAYARTLIAGRDSSVDGSK